MNLFFLICILAVIEVSILFLSDFSKTKKFFDVIPSVFWIYFIPMLLSNANVIPSQSPLYNWATTYILPASLFLLLLGVDVPAIFKLGQKGLMLFFIGALGMMLGTVISFSVFHEAVGNDFWMGFGALCASWTGGSANMVAVKEALATPDAIFAPMVIVDTIVPYVWMAILIGISSWQERFNRLVNTDRNFIKEMQERLGRVQAKQFEWSVMYVSIILSFAGLVSFGVNYYTPNLPVIKGVISTYTWTIIAVSILGLMFSFSTLRTLESKGSTKVGYYLLYFVLITIGAKASVAHLDTSLLLIAAGLLIVSVHAVVLLIGGWILRAPMALLATASQANIGGVASAPVVAEIYQTGLAPIGLLMAILGNIAGTYLGIMVAQVCRIISGS